MNNKLTTPSSKPSALVALASQLNVDHKNLLSCLQNTAFKGASQDEMMALCIVASTYGLNPFTKEIYAFPQKGGGIVPIVSIDGWLRIINTHPQFDGMEVEMSEDGQACTVTMYRKDLARPIVVSEYLDECRRPTDPWAKMPRRMLRHKAIIQAARVAFGFSGMTDPDSEQDLKDNMRDVTPKASPLVPAPALSPAPALAPAPVAEVEAPPVVDDEPPMCEPEPQLGDLFLDCPDEGPAGYATFEN